MGIKRQKLRLGIKVRNCGCVPLTYRLGGGGGVFFEGTPLFGRFKGKPIGKQHTPSHPNLGEPEYSMVLTSVCSQGVIPIIPSKRTNLSEPPTPALAGLFARNPMLGGSSHQKHPYFQQGFACGSTVLIGNWVLGVDNTCM